MSTFKVRLFKINHDLHKVELVGDFKYPTMPRVGEHICPDDDFPCYRVLRLRHNFNEGFIEVIVEISEDFFDVAT